MVTVCAVPIWQPVDSGSIAASAAVLGPVIGGAFLIAVLGLGLLLRRRRRRKLSEAVDVDLDEDVEEFSAAVTHRRLGDALDVVKRRSGLIVSVVVPALVLLRWPGAAVWVLRGGAPLASWRCTWLFSWLFSRLCSCQCSCLCSWLCSWLGMQLTMQLSESGGSPQ